ncbi:hypothetical protein [Streptomyces sp. NPDC054838]
MVEEDTSIQFRLGDPTLKMIKPKGRGINHGVFLVLDRFADEIGSAARTDTLCTESAVTAQPIT